MPTQMEQDASSVIKALAEYQQNGEDDESRGLYFLSGSELQGETGLAPPRVNDSVALLETNGYVNVVRTFGNQPFDFREVGLTPLGRYEYQRLFATSVDQPRTEAGGSELVKYPVPVGSPFGFTDIDWEYISSEHRKQGRLKVVLGYQFSSEHYDGMSLIKNVQLMFEEAVALYNARSGHDPLTIELTPLAAGYGEHLFNQIARDIITAHVAVFETSDHNPNVMIEMGVRVLPIKSEGRPRPPSDISGQTWADYRNSGADFADPDHPNKLVSMIEWAIRRRAS